VNFLAAVRELLPLRIERAIYQNEVLSLSGPEWTMASMAPWRVGSDHRLLFGWETEAAGERVAGLRGLDIVSVAPQSGSVGTDPCFTLSDGTFLELFATHPLEPWTMSLPGITFVASPDSEDWGSSFAG
jgi:hypothetical protein